MVWESDWPAGIETLSSAQPLLPSLPVLLTRSVWVRSPKQEPTSLDPMLAALLVRTSLPYSLLTGSRCLTVVFLSACTLYCKVVI